MSISHHPWLLRQPNPFAALRLFCFPYAGASATVFLPWQDTLGAGIDVCAVQLPGRGSRYTEPCIASLPVLVEQLAELIRHHGDRRFAFVGYSLGGLLAFELARYCRRHQLPQPLHLIVSGSPAPGKRWLSARLHELDDDALLAALECYNGTPKAALENRG